MDNNQQADDAVKTQDYRVILRTVGAALLVAGILDIGVMAYCIANEISYSSSFNIFAVIAGIYLLRGGLRTAGYVAFFSAFMFAGFSGLVLLQPLLSPLDLRIIEFKQNPVFYSAIYILMPIILLFVFWVYRKLTSNIVLEARKQSGLSHSKQKLGFALGALLVIGLSYAMYLLNYGDSALRAKQMAADVYGHDYSYHVNRLNYAGANTHAYLTAYNENEIKYVDVEWEQ